jgi:hypothetical protein
MSQKRKGTTAYRERQQRAIDRLVDQAQYAVSEQERKDFSDQIAVIRKNMMKGRQSG